MVIQMTDRFGYQIKPLMEASLDAELNQRKGMGYENSGLFD